MPGLLTLKTDLKSLKYGQDTPGGGDSGLPYIKTNINTVDSGINKLRFTKFDDGLIRGGAVGAIGSSVVDTLRIGKFLTDFPKGPLFIVKQVGLQLTNPRVESTTLPTNKPTTGQGFLNNVGNFISNVANKVENAVGPTRIYNLGINTLAQVPVNALGGHIVRHGFLPNNDDSKYYENVIKVKNFQNDTNRLLDLTNNFNLGPWGTNKPGLNKKEQGVMDKLKGLASASPFGAAAFGALNAVFNTNKENEIDSYLGGASSVYGIGTTTIRRFSDTEDKDKIEFARKQSIALAGKTRDEKGNPTEVEFGLDRLLGASNNATSSLSAFYFLSTKENITNNDTYIPVNLNNRIASSNDNTVRNTNGHDNKHDLSKYGPTLSYPGIDTGSFSNDLNLPDLVYGIGASTYDDIKSNIDHLTAPNNLGIYAQLFYSQSNQERLPDSKYSPIYENYYGDKIVIKAANATGWNDLTRENRVGSGRQDAINLTPIFDADAGTHIDTVTINGVSHNINDLVKFRIQAIDTDKPTQASWMIFRAYITDLSDSVDATWTGIKYAGRGDQFFIYDGFTRKMSVTFKVAALSRQEMEPMYQKLNFLMSNLMPDYDLSKNVMRGPLSRMTIGNWIDGQLCILNSLSYKIPADSPWEIGLSDQELILPHIVEVTLGFTPIGSQTRDKNELPRKEDCVSNIAQNWNGATEREYIIPCPEEAPPPQPKPTVPDPQPNPKPDPKPTPPKMYEIPPATSDYLGAGAGFERSQGNTDAQRTFREKQLDRKFGF